MDLTNIKIECRKIKVEEFQILRNSTTWDTLKNEVVQKALDNDLFSVCVFDEEKLIGMGRVIGDGAIYFYIQDVIVLPAYQGKGIGTLIMNNIENYLLKNTNKNSFIGLMAAKGVSKFYENFGYQARPNSAPGMYKII